MKDAYGDEVPDSEDACPNSDVRPTVFVGTCNAIVPTISFRTAAPWRTIADAAAQSKNHAAFVSGVAHLTNDWVRQGIITGAQKGAIQSCAGKAKLPLIAQGGSRFCNRKIRWQPNAGLARCKISRRQ